MIADSSSRQSEEDDWTKASNDRGFNVVPEQPNPLLPIRPVPSRPQKVQTIGKNSKLDPDTVTSPSDDLQIFNLINKRKSSIADCTKDLKKRKKSQEADSSMKSIKNIVTDAQTLLLVSTSDKTVPPLRLKKVCRQEITNTVDPKTVSNVETNDIDKQTNYRIVTGATPLPDSSPMSTLISSWTSHIDCDFVNCHSQLTAQSRTELPRNKTPCFSFLDNSQQRYDDGPPKLSPPCPVDSSVMKPIEDIRNSPPILPRISVTVPPIVQNETCYPVKDSWNPTKYVDRSKIGTDSPIVPKVNKNIILGLEKMLAGNEKFRDSGGSFAESTTNNDPSPPPPPPFPPPLPITTRTVKPRKYKTQRRTSIESMPKTCQENLTSTTFPATNYNERLSTPNKSRIMSEEFQTLGNWVASITKRPVLMNNPIQILPKDSNPNKSITTPAPKAIATTPTTTTTTFLRDFNNPMTGSTTKPSQWNTDPRWQSQQLQISVPPRGTYCSSLPMNSCYTNNCSLEPYVASPYNYSTPMFTYNDYQYHQRYPNYPVSNYHHYPGSQESSRSLSLNQDLTRNYSTPTTSSKVDDSTKNNNTEPYGNRMIPNVVAAAATAAAMVAAASLTNQPDNSSSSYNKNESGMGSLMNLRANNVPQSRVCNSNNCSSMNNANTENNRSYHQVQSLIFDHTDYRSNGNVKISIPISNNSTYRVFPIGRNSKDSRRIYDTPHLAKLNRNTQLLINGTECFNCGLAGSMFKCLGCEAAFYCNERCQAQHWAVHVEKCPKKMPKLKKVL